MNINGSSLLLNFLCILDHTKLSLRICVATPILVWPHPSLIFTLPCHTHSNIHCTYSALHQTHAHNHFTASTHAVTHHHQLHCLPITHVHIFACLPWACTPTSTSKPHPLTHPTMLTHHILVRLLSSSWVCPQIETLLAARSLFCILSHSVASGQSSAHIDADWGWWHPVIKEEE